MTQETQEALSRIVNLTSSGDDRRVAERYLKEGGIRIHIESFIARAEQNILSWK